MGPRGDGGSTGDAADVAIPSDVADAPAPSCPPGSGDLAGTIDEARSQQAPRDPRLPRFILEGATPGEGGAIYVYGYMNGCTERTGNSDAVVARVYADGRLDPGFGGEGKVCVHREDATGSLGSSIYALTRDPVGRVVAVGIVQGRDRAASGLVLRFDASGRPDRSFGRDGVLEHFVMGEGHGGTAFYDVVVDERGIVLVGGDNHAFTPNSYGFVLRLLDDGTPDPTFHGGAAWVDATAEVFSAVAVVDGGYAIAGHDRVGRRARVARLDVNGDLVPTFGVGGTATFEGRGIFVRGLVADHGGGFVVGGAPSGLNDVPFGLALQRFDRDGRPDLSFGRRGTYVGTQAWDIGYLRRPVMTSQCDGSIVVAAHGARDMQLTRVSPAGALDTSFGESGVTHLGPLGDLRAAFVDADGTITAVGVRHAPDNADGGVVALWRVHP